MKIAICAKTTDETGLVASRFARSEFFIIYNSETLSFKAIVNPAKEEGSGAGGKAVKVLNDNDVDIVLGPEVGPKAFEALKAFEIKAFNLGKSITVKDAIYSYYENKLIETVSANAKGHH
ncbi:MAG: NifB/NifX family molybdenum-iron cluster-binding protein [Candidatus Izemoplasma sp.]